MKNNLGNNLLKKVFLLAFITAANLTIFAQQDSLSKAMPDSVKAPLIGSQQKADSSNGIDFAKPTEFVVKGVDVKGANNTDKQILRTISGLKIGEKIKIPGEDITKAIKNLWKQKLFTNVSVDIEKIVGKEVFLSINVEERPRLAGWKLMGIKTSDAEEINKKLDMRKGSIFTENMKLTSVNKIKNYYKEKGYLDVTVSLDETGGTVLKNTINPKFIINKGGHVKINNIDFEGTTQFSDGTLRGKMKDTKEKVKFDLEEMLKFKKNFVKEPNHPKWYHIPGHLSPSRMFEYGNRFANLNFFKASKFKRKEYESDKQKIVEFYQSKGYRDAKIDWDTVYRADDRNLSIKIRVNEGNQYHFRNFIYNGNTKYPDSLLSKIIGIKKGEIYNQRMLDEKLMSNPQGGDISSLYMDDGYLFFQVTPLEVKVDKDSIDIELRISEGPQATINEVRIMGNTKTNEKVVRRELRTLPGNKFSRTDLIRSQREIVNLGYFDPQQLDVVPIPNPEKGTVDIEYRLTEKPSDQLELSFGYGGKQQGVVGTLGVTFTNFSLRNMFNKKSWSPLPSGDGQRLSVRVQASGRTAQFYTLSFTEPWLGGKRPNSLTVAFNHTNINNVSNFGLGPILGSYKVYGATVAFGKRLKWPDDFFTFEAALNYQNFTFNNYGGILAGFTNGSAHNLNASISFGRNSLDAPLYPRHGSNFRFTASATLPYSLMFNNLKNLDYDTIAYAQKYKLAEYFKFKFSAEWYTTIVQNLVFKASAKMGFLGYYNPKIGLPIFERFQVGGNGMSNTTGNLGKDIISARGYDVYTPQSSVGSFAFGAGIYNKFDLELRYPFSLNPSATIFGILFFEGSNAWQNIKDYKPYQLYKSAGFGLRVFLPMFGLLGVDYAFPLDKLGLGSNVTDHPKGLAKIVLGQEPE